MIVNRHLGPAPEWRWRMPALISGVLCAVLVAASLVIVRTNAAFTAATNNSTNAWTSGTVVIGDDDSGSALFSVSGLLPGDTGTRCIRVLYTGSIAANVRLYLQGTSGTLAQYLQVTVTEGAGAGNTGSYAGGCTGFSGTVRLNDTLSNIASTASGYSTGAGTFAPTGSGQFQVYSISYTLPANTPNVAQATSASTTFVWEARS